MKSTTYLAVLFILLAMAHAALASGTQWKVTFEDNGTAPEGSAVNVLFTAAGCAGIKRCSTVTGSLTDKVATVCKQALNVTPGETVKYSYKLGTSNRALLICSNADSSSAFRNQHYKSQTKHTHVCAQENGSWRTYGDKACTKKVGSLDTGGSD